MEEQEIEPDLRGPAVVVRGSVLGGFKFHGPFETIDAACKWCESGTLAGVLNLDGQSTIVLLEEPRTDGTLV